MQINLLALDTSGKACSVALQQGEKVSQLMVSIERQQTKQLLPQIQKLLDESGISLSLGMNSLHALAFACGPGSFTGIRLAASVIQGLAFGANLPVIPISTLQVMAQGAYIEFGAQRVVVAINAYGGKIYWGVYRLPVENGVSCMMPVCPDILCFPQEANLPAVSLTTPSRHGSTEIATNFIENEKWIGVGDAWVVYKDLLRTCLKSSISDIQIICDQPYSQAKHVADLALIDFKANKTLPAEKALPVYLYGAEYWFKK